MRIQDCIIEHKEGLILFLNIKRPQFICKSDDDYIDYINYCWEFIVKSNNELKSLSFMNDDNHIDIEHLAQEVRRAYGVLELCHKFLSGKSVLASKAVNVYTTTMAHERR